jgi:hypothetical protein
MDSLSDTHTASPADDYSLFEAHPYFVFPALRRIKMHHSEMDADTLEALKRAVILQCADPEAAATYADLDGDDWGHFYPAPAPTPEISTNDAIDTFLENYGNRSPEQDALLERLIFNPMPDYSMVLQQEEDDRHDEPQSPASPRDSLIDRFISTHPDGTPPPLATPEESADDYFESLERQAAGESQKQTTERSTPHRATPTEVEPAIEAPQNHSALSESLAKIYIKQRRYERAYEIISELSLKNPEKSIYFADQMRFLKKLIVIERMKAEK